MDANAFAEEWEAAWSSHSLDRILSHYSDDIVFRSAKALALSGKGEIQGKASLRAYWGKALERQPELRFSVVDIFVGHDMLVLTYRNHRQVLAAETLRFGRDGLVIEGSACHRRK